MAPMTLPPGFRFHPTDDELVSYYLHRKIHGRSIELEIIPEVDLYKCEPWDLPDKSFLPGKDMEWYFYSPRDRKYPNGSRTNRATRAGYWKATGKDRPVQSYKVPVGMKKTLVYYRGRAPHGIRTNWVMHEYRLIDSTPSSTTLKDSYALCRVIKKTVSTPKTKQDEDEEEHVITNTNTKQSMEEETSGIEVDENGINEDSKIGWDDSSSDLTQGTPTQTPFAFDEANSSLHSFGLDCSMYLLQDMEMGGYAPLQVEDFPQFNFNSNMDYMNATLEDIFSL